MKQIPILSGRCLVVELPEGATDPFVAKTYIDEDGHVYKTDPQWLEWSGTYPENILDLPSGTWQIVGRLSELFYHDFDGLIEPAKVFDYTAHYWNYIEKEYQPIMQIESLESAIRAEGYYLDKNPYADNLRDAVDKTPSSDYASKLEEANIFRQAQTRVLDRSRCLLLGRDG